MVGPGEERGGPEPGQVPPGPWDPARFRDDDGKWYLYWDLSNGYQIFANESPDPSQQSLELPALDGAQTYSVAIEAFNRSGVSGRSRIVRIVGK